MLNKFFDDYPKFYETSKTTAEPQRLAYRYHLIIEQNKNILDGKSIIEIAAHDGRWAFAALKAGANFVYGVEPRKHLVDNANKTFATYRIPTKNYEFVCEDGYFEAEKLVREGRKFDTAFLLGFLYHTAREYEIIYRMSQLGCNAIIIDTVVLHNVTEPIIRLGMERTDGEGNLFSPGKTVDVTGVPSLTAVNYMLKGAGYQPYTITPNIPTPKIGCNDYRNGSRFTIVGIK